MAILTIPKEAKKEIQEGKLTFVVRDNNSWYPGRRLHLWLNTPQCGGSPLELPIECADYWEVLRANEVLPPDIYTKSEMLAAWPSGSAKPSWFAVPVCCATEKVDDKVLVHWKMTSLVDRDSANIYQH